MLSLPVVKNKDTHKGTLIYRQLMATALLLAVLLSSCSLKRGVKVLFDIPVKTEQAGTFGHYNSSVGYGEITCLHVEDLQLLTADSFNHSLLKNLTSAIFITAVFSLLGLPFFRPEEKDNFKTPTLGGSIPKYLLFSKLLFYDLR